MNKLGKDVDRTKDKVAGEVKQAAGKITDNKELELKGKLQSAKADLNKKASDTADKIDDKKDKVTAKINNKIDKVKRDMKK